MKAAARHPGVRVIQDLLIKKAEQMCLGPVIAHLVPADDSHAERELRPTVIARKVSGSAQSEGGAKTREMLTNFIT